jgi:hypothetical protein
MEYTIVSSKNREDFIAKVNKLILEGWKPQGGVCESGGSSMSIFYQAMIKFKE